MPKRYIVNLTSEERESLRELVTRKRVSGLKRLRGQILLKADEGLTDEEIVDELEVGIVTVERVRKRCCEYGIHATLEGRERKHPARPRKFDGATEARLVQLACSSPPEGRARWTLTLLGERLVQLEIFDSVSNSSIQRTLKKTI